MGYNQNRFMILFSCAGILLFFAFCLNFSGQSATADSVFIINDRILNDDSFKKENTIYILKNRYDLKGKKISLPKSSK